jgi:hypothetical protein
MPNISVLPPGEKEKNEISEYKQKKTEICGAAQKKCNQRIQHKSMSTEK